MTALKESVERTKKSQKSRKTGSSVRKAKRPRAKKAS